MLHKYYRLFNYSEFDLYSVWSRIESPNCVITWAKLAGNTTVQECGLHAATTVYLIVHAHMFLGCLLKWRHPFFVEILNLSVHSICSGAWMRPSRRVAWILSLCTYINNAQLAGQIAVESQMRWTLAPFDSPHACFPCSYERKSRSTFLHVCTCIYIYMCIIWMLEYHQIGVLESSPVYALYQISCL